MLFSQIWRHFYIFLKLVWVVLSVRGRSIRGSKVFHVHVRDLVKKLFYYEIIGENTGEIRFLFIFDK